MALNVPSYILTHSVKVSTKLTMSKNQNPISDEVVVDQDLERQAHFAAAGLPITPLNLLPETLVPATGGEIQRNFGCSPWRGGSF